MRVNAYETQKSSSIAAGDTRTLQSWGEDKGQRLNFLLCKCDWSKWRIHLEMKMEKMGRQMCVFHNQLCIYLFTLCLSLLPLLLSFSISLRILPPSSYDPRVIHKGKVVRLGLNMNSDPLVSSGSKHTRTFINDARAPLCIIVVILILSTVTFKQQQNRAANRPATHSNQEQKSQL